MVLHAHALQAMQVRLKSVSNEEHATFEVETVFAPIARMIAVGSLSNSTWYSLCMR
jgi:hypothetical protein